MRRRSFAWVSLLVLLAGMLWAGRPILAVSAHALLVHSLPEADAVLSETPPAIEIWFTEALEPGFSQIQLFDATGKEIATDAMRLDSSDDAHMVLPLGHLDPGIYTVAWQTLSKADGHEFSGSYPFTLLNPDGTPPNGERVAAGGDVHASLPAPGDWLARWLLLLGSSILFGVALFQVAIITVRKPVSPQQVEPLDAAIQNQAVIAIWITMLAFSLGQWLHLILQGIDLGGFYRLPDLLLGTRAGALILARQTVALTILLVAMKLPQPRPVNEHKRAATLVMALLTIASTILLVTVALKGEYLIALLPTILSCLGLGLTGLVRGKTNPPSWRQVWAYIVVLAGVLLLFIALASHASSGSGKFWAVLVDYIHLMAAGAWVGGLLSIAAWLLWTRRLPEPGRSMNQLLFMPTIQRFSYLASFCVFVLVLSGLFNSLVQLPNIPLLWQTTYGRVLLTKLGLIMLAMGAAFLNNRLVHSRWTGNKTSDKMPIFTRQIVLESGIVLFLMLSVAVLVQTPTPRDIALLHAAQQPGLPFNTVVTGDDLSLHIQVTPNQVGKNRFWVHAFHADGSAVGEIQLMQLRLNYRDMPLGQVKVDLAPLDEDEFAVEGSYFSQAGGWNISAYIRRRDMDDTLILFNLDVPKPSAGISASNPWQNPIPSIPAGIIIFCSFLALAVIPILWREPLQQALPWYKFSWRSVILIGYACAVVGVVLLIAIGPSIFNSLPVSNGSSAVVSFEQGKTLYEARCESCHGPTGLGDGPAAAGLKPPPANLQVHLAGGGHSDEQIFRWISDGILNSAMPSFKNYLTEDERWQIVKYLRTLVPK